VTDQDLLGDSLSGFEHHKLIAARESLGISASALQRDLKLTSAVFSAIETGQLDQLGQPVFARGYIRNYCNRVGLDPEPFVDQYNLALGERPVKRRSAIKSAGSATAGTVMKLNPRRASSLLTLLFRLVIIAAILAGVAFGASKINWSSLGLSGLFDGSESEEQQSTQALPPLVGESEGLSIPIKTTTQEPIDTVPDKAPEAIELPKPADTPDLEPKSAPVPVKTEQPQPIEQPVTNEPLTATPVNSEGADGLTIKFSDVSWLNIKDATGEALFNGLSKKGQDLEIKGQAPFSIVIGRANAVSSVTFDGSTVDLEPHTRKNVARLTLSR
jgi:cytoskeleton protein RodZ